MRLENAQLSVDPRTKTASGLQYEGGARAFLRDLARELIRPDGSVTSGYLRIQQSRGRVSLRAGLSGGSATTATRFVAALVREAYGPRAEAALREYLEASTGSGRTQKIGTQSFAKLMIALDADGVAAGLERGAKNRVASQGRLETDHLGNEPEAGRLHEEGSGHLKHDSETSSARRKLRLLEKTITDQNDGPRNGALMYSARDRDVDMPFVRRGGFRLALAGKSAKKNTARELRALISQAQLPVNSETVKALHAYLRAGEFRGVAVEIPRFRQLLQEVNNEIKAPQEARFASGLAERTVHSVPARPEARGFGGFVADQDPSREEFEEEVRSFFADRVPFLRLRGSAKEVEQMKKRIPKESAALLTDIVLQVGAQRLPGSPFPFSEVRRRFEASLETVEQLDHSTFADMTQSGESPEEKIPAELVQSPQFRQLMDDFVAGRWRADDPPREVTMVRFEPAAREGILEHVRELFQDPDAQQAIEILADAGG